MKRTLLAILTATFLTGCVTTEGRIKQAAESGEVERRIAEIEAEIKKSLILPPECERQFRIGAQEGDSALVALIKADIALGRANSTILRCAAFVNKVRNGL